MIAKQLLLILSFCLLNCAGHSHGNALLLYDWPISHAEVRLHDDLFSVYDVVQELRPYWLGRRASGAPRELIGPSVYIDRQYYGNVDSLRNMRARFVVMITYLNPFDAGMQFGGYHPAGVILVEF